MNVLITSGFNNSKPSVYLAEQLTSKGISIHTISTKNNINFSKIYSLIKKEGWKELINYALKYFNLPKKNNSKNLNLIMSNYDYPKMNISKWCQLNNVKNIQMKNINDPEFIRYVKKSEIDCIFYTGGGIIGKELIEAVKGNIINFHSGPLPTIRGMNAIEWSLVLNKKIAVSTHFINTGIDTGRVINKYSLKIHDVENIEDLRNKAIFQCIKDFCLYINKEKLKELMELNKDNANSSNSRQCFKMSPLLRSLAEIKLQQIKNEKVF